MKNTIPKNPVHLAVFLGNLISGDDKHQLDGPLPKDVRADLETAKSKLDSLNSAVRLSKGQFRQSSQERREFVTALEAEKFRDAVFSRAGHKDQVLVDYGLVVRTKAHRGTGGAQSPSGASKAERAKVHLAKMKAQLDRANERSAALAARIAQKEAEVARAAEVTPPEPVPPSQPASDSVTK